MSVSHAARASATACGEGACGAGDCAGDGAGACAAGGDVEDGGVGSRSSANAACAAMTEQKMNGSSDLVMLNSCLDGPNAWRVDTEYRAGCFWTTQSRLSTA